MKQRYTITIADMEVNVVSDGSPEAVESLVGMVDRKMREILLANRRCSKSQAALLCALDYCSDKVDAMRKVKQIEATLDAKETELRAAQKEAAALRAEADRLALELETMRASLLAAQTQKNEAALTVEAPEAAEVTAEAAEAPVSDPDQVTLTEVETEVAQETVTIAPPTPVVPDAPTELLEPEDVEFDPTEIFRRAKANRGGRKRK